MAALSSVALAPSKCPPLIAFELQPNSGGTVPYGPPWQLFPPQGRGELALSQGRHAKHFLWSRGPGLPPLWGKIPLGIVTKGPAYGAVLLFCRFFSHHAQVFQLAFWVPCWRILRQPYFNLLLPVVCQAQKILFPWLGLAWTWPHCWPMRRRISVPVRPVRLGLGSSNAWPQKLGSWLGHIHPPVPPCAARYGVAT